MSIGTESSRRNVIRFGLSYEQVSDLIGKLKKAGYALDPNNLGSHGICPVYSRGKVKACVYGNCIDPVGDDLAAHKHIKEIAESV